MRVALYRRPPSCEPNALRWTPLSWYRCGTGCRADQVSLRRVRAQAGRAGPPCGPPREVPRVWGPSPGSAGVGAAPALRAPRAAGAHPARLAPRWPLRRPSCEFPIGGSCGVPVLRSPPSRRSAVLRQVRSLHRPPKADDLPRLRRRSGPRRPVLPKLRRVPTLGGRARRACTRGVSRSATHGRRSC